MPDRDRPLLIVKIDRQLFAIESAFIREVVSAPPVFSLPFPLDDIQSLAVLRGEPHAILDGLYFLRLPHRERDKVLFLIGHMGLFVDDAIQTIRHDLPETDPETLKKDRSWFHPYTINFRGQEIPVLNVPKVLTHVPDKIRPFI